MFAYFGELKLEMSMAPTSFSEKREYAFAEHPVLQGRPQLQKIGENLREQDLAFRFHRGFCDPAAAIGLLRDLAEAQDAFLFVLGDGTFEGDYVITSIGSVVEMLDGSGAAVWIEVTVTLKEVPPERVVQAEQKRAKSPKPQKGARVRSAAKGKSSVASANRIKLAGA